jgi:lipopolysaccharide biosynthesis glycosyltransferase
MAELQQKPVRTAVYVCTDRRMLVPALYVAAAAVRERIRSGADYDVLLFAAMADVDDSHRRWMANNGIRHISDLDVAQLSRIDITQERFCQANLYRLMVPTYLSGQYDRLIYLDADVSIRGPLAPLFSLDMSGFGIAALPAGEIPELMSGEGQQEEHNKSMRSLGLTEPYRYFNSGVMLIDIDQWIRDQTGVQTLDFLIQNVAICPFLDESAMSSILDGRFARLSPVWNLRSGIFRVPGAARFVEPVVVHFDGPVKPWKKFGDSRPLFLYREEYQEYRDFLKDTPWPGWLDEQWRIGDLLKNFRFEAAMHRNRLIGRKSWFVYTLSEQRSIERGFAQYCRTAPFADVEQGIVVHDGRALRLAG